MIELKKIK